jgi:hypothetical protein
MTLNLAAIFGAEPSNSGVAAPAVRPTDSPVVAPAQVVKPWPIVQGTEHFSIWVDDDAGTWPEFIAGYHYDFRQPSRLRPLLASMMPE